MDKKFLRSIIHKYFGIVEENIKEGHYVETDFRHYSELVKALIDIQITYNSKPIYFTALCLPPFQWLNFKIDNPDVSSIKEVTKMEADPTWTQYIRLADSLRSGGTNIYRCIFCAQDGFDRKSIFRDLLESNKIEQQFDASSILVRKSDALSPLNSDELKQMIHYSCYENAASAYLIIDSSEKSLSYNQNDYELMRLRDFFARFQPIGQLKTWTYKKNHSLNTCLPEDFFLCGSGENIEDAEWYFALAADVTKDLKKVRLWFVTEDLTAKEKLANRIYI